MTHYFTVVYRDIQPGDEARILGEHPKASAMSWSHALNDRDTIKEQLDLYISLNASLLRQNLEFARKLISVPTEAANADQNPA
jgi:hypothetical protein